MMLSARGAELFFRPARPYKACRAAAGHIMKFKQSTGPKLLEKGRLIPSSIPGSSTALAVLGMYARGWVVHTMTI